MILGREARRRPVHFLLAALACGLIALLVPALAGANEPLVVNGTGDGSTATACKTEAGECTLRGAIEAANEVAGFDTIDFDLSPIVDTIDLNANPLPEIGAQTTISGGFCPNGPGVYKPCVTLKAPATFPALEVADHVVVESLAVEGGKIGVKVNGESTTLSQDVITESTVGIELSEEGANDEVEGTTVKETGRTGIEVEASGSRLIGNTITATGWGGIEVGHRSEHDRIGGDGAGKANTIDGSETRGAIVIYGEESSRNEVASNFGSGNFGPFIQLRPHGSKNPNGEIKPPTFTTGLLASASGSAVPNATVRIFRKASAEEGELAALLAVVKADSSGHWQATWAPLAAGTLITATQTSEAGTPEAGTSELATPRALVQTEGGGGGASGSGRGGSATPTPPVPATAPKVKITARPKKSSKSTTAKFKFTASVAGAKFECKFDGAKKWAKCSSPKTYKRLKPGKHTFRVRAQASGLTSAVAKDEFTVKS